MASRRAVWLIVWPAVSVLVAVMIGAAAIAAASVLTEPDALVEAEPGFRGILDNLGVSGGLDVSELTQTPATLAGVILAVLAWSVTLGVGAQRFFPLRRRLAPAVLAVALTCAMSWLAILIQGVGREPGAPFTLGQLVSAAVASALVAGVVVFALGGHRWPLRLPERRGTPVHAHLADLL